MANVEEFLNKLKKATYGIEVRQSIVDVIEAINLENLDLTHRQECLAEIFNSLVINAGNSNAEIVVARGDFDSLVQRLDDIDNKIIESNKSVLINVNDYASFQDALNEAKKNSKTIIYVPAGTYLIDNTLKIYSNTELVLSKNAVIKKNSKSFNVMLLNGDLDANYDTYKGQSNISVNGGIWDGNFELNSQSNIMSFGKAQNIVIENVTFKDVTNNHHLEFSGVENATVKNCRFTGYKDITVDKSRGYCEAIQISTHTESGFPFFGSYDNSPSKNIVIDNCYFEDVACGVGSHGAVSDVFDSEIKIINNTFKRCSYGAVRLHKMKNVIVNSNTFDDCRIGVYSSVSLSNYDVRPKTEASEDIVITNNIFSNASNNLSEYSNQIFITGGCVNESDYDYAKRITINNNVFSDIKKHSIRLQLSSDINVTNNIINGSKSGVYCDLVDYANISSNTIKNCVENGIKITKLSSVQMGESARNNFNRINDNLLENIGESAIATSYMIDSVINKNIMQVVCTNSNGTVPCIILSNSCKKVGIDDNFLRNYKITCNYGIHIDNTCEIITTKFNDVQGTINYINNAGTNGSFEGFFIIDNITKDRKTIRLQSGALEVV